MPIPDSIGDREYQKFCEGQDGKLSVRMLKAGNADALATSNMTTTPLGAGETYTGEWLDVSQYPSVVFAVLADQDGDLFADFAIANTGSQDTSLSFKVLANINEVHKLTVTRRYFRLRYVNGSVAQTSFQTTLLVGDHGPLTAPANLPLAQDADAIVARTIDFDLDIAEGKRSGYSKVNKLGKNSDIDTGTVPEWVTEAGGVYTGFPLTDDETIAISSSSANDAAAGTGARTVRIIGLDSDFNVIAETVTLNGTTPVNTVNTFRRAHTMFVTTSGSNEFNVGTITATHSTTTANVFLTIVAGIGSSNYAVYTIPAGKTGYMIATHGGIRRGGSATVDGALWIRTEGAAPRYRRPFTIGRDAPHRLDIFGGTRYAEKTDIGAVITFCTANNTAVTFGFDLILVDN